MGPRSRSAKADRIGEFWDAVVQGAPQAELDHFASNADPELVESIAALRSADDARVPSDAFMSRFEAQFASMIQSELKPATKPSNGVHAVPRMVTLPAADAHDVAAPISINRYRKSFLYGFAAAAVLAILIAGAYYLVSSKDNQTSVADQPNVIPVPPREFEVPMDRGNPQRSGVLPGPGVSEGLELRWQFDAGQGAMSAPAMVGDTLFVTGGSEAGTGGSGSGSVVAIDFLTGSERWRFPTEYEASVTPAVVDGIVYASDTGVILYALDAATGNRLWQADLQGGWSSAPVVADDRIFVAVAPYQVSLQVAVRDNTVVVGSGLVGQTGGIQLFAIDPASGRVLWQAPESLSGQPGLMGFDASSGEPRWTYSMSSLESGPAISGQRVFAGSSLDRTVYALDLVSGEEIWQAAIGEDLPLNSAPALSGGSVFITTAFGKIVSLDEGTGEERWRATAEHVSVSSSPIVIDDIVYVVDTAYGVSAISAADGSVLWTQQLDLAGQVVVPPIILYGTLFIGTSLQVQTNYVAALWAFTGTGSDDRAAGESS